MDLSKQGQGQTGTTFFRYWNVVRSADTTFFGLGALWESSWTQFSLVLRAKLLLTVALERFGAHVGTPRQAKILVLPWQSADLYVCRRLAFRCFGCPSWGHLGGVLGAHFGQNGVDSEVPDDTRTFLITFLGPRNFFRLPGTTFLGFLSPSWAPQEPSEGGTFGATPRGLRDSAPDSARTPRCASVFECMSLRLEAFARW